MNLPSPLRAAEARVNTRADVLQAAANPGEPVALRITEGRSRPSLHQRASEYRRGLLPYGLAMPAEYIADAYADPEVDVVALVLQPGAPVPDGHSLKLIEATGRSNIWAAGSRLIRTCATDTQPSAGCA